MSPLSTPSQQGYHVQTVKPFTFILQLSNSSVRCNCASHQLELGLLNCPPQSFILLQYRDYHVPTAPPNFHSITAIANMYNLFLKHPSLSHAFVCQDFQVVSLPAENKMAAIFGLVDRARSNAAHAQTGIFGDRQSGNYP